MMVSRILETIWDKRNLAVVAEYFASDYLGHSITEIHGPDGMMEWAGNLFQAFPNNLFTIQDQVAEGDKVVTRWVVRGTQTYEFEGLSPTDKEVTLIGIDIFRIAKGKIIEGWLVISMKRCNHE